MYVCCCALQLLFATMICLGSFFIVLNTNHPGFSFLCMCVLWCSMAPMCRHDLFWLLFIGYKPPRVFVFPCMCVVGYVAAFCHHDLFWLFLCFMNHKSPRVSIPMCACCCGLLLLRVAMICAGSFFVLFIQLTQVFPFPCMCLLWCSVAAACHNDLLWLLFCFGQYKSQVFLFHVCVCVAVLCGCGLPP